MAVCKNILCKGLQSRKLYVYLPLRTGCRLFASRLNIFSTADKAAIPEDDSTQVVSAGSQNFKGIVASFVDINQILSCMRTSKNLIADAQRVSVSTLTARKSVFTYPSLNKAGLSSDRSTSVSLRFLAEIQRRLAFFVCFQIVYQKNAKKRKQFDSRRTRCVRFNAYGAKDRIHASSGATNQTLLSGIAFGRSESLRHCEFAFDSSISCGFPRRGDQNGLQSPEKQISKTCNLDREYCLLSDKPGRFIVFPGNIRFRSMCVAFVA